MSLCTQWGVGVAILGREQVTCVERGRKQTFLGGESQPAQLGGKVVWFPLCALGRPTVQGPWPHLAPQSEKPIWGWGGHQLASTRQVV